jgi:hypothetical protein
VKFDTPFITDFYEGDGDEKRPRLLRVTGEDLHSYFVYDYLTEETYDIDRGELEYEEEETWYLTEKQTAWIRMLIDEGREELEAEASDLRELNDELTQEIGSLRIINKALDEKGKQNKH